MRSFVFTRRQFLKLVGATTATALTRPSWARLLASRVDKPAVVWLEGQDCAGCTESILASIDPDLRSVVIDLLAIRYHETIMAGTGIVAEGALQAAIQDGGYLLVVEGAMPSADPDFLQVAGVHLEETFVSAAEQAAAIIAVGACASFGGIPRAGITKGQGVDYFLRKHGISKPLINLPGCPTHPTWFFDTVHEYLDTGVPQLDSNKRPVAHFGRTVHSACPRRHNYSRRRFLTDWNNPAQSNYCLLKKGCKGPSTKSSCGRLLWNDGANWCIGNNAPCSGCTEPEFYAGLSPIYSN